MNMIAALPGLSSTGLNSMGATGTGLDAMLAGIRRAARVPLAERPAAVAAAIAPHLGDAGLLAGRDCPCNPDRYVRHLLEEGEGYAVVALVWRPGQMSPVHSHHTWCALGVHRGCLTEHFFTPGAPPRPKAALLRGEGATSHGPADPELIHRIANCCAEVAVSIHVYGVPFAQFSDGVNCILA
ncbi:cysteine dioxygenase family protein [Sediminicoccus sp. KRV36]|uniref:cysteine dioxygenase family protein n=1 Tax=Sediminicoccus sp. KRV36 TaxID=3133721 RepID=UPI00200D8453|nr:cysteine dioxygenase family protein [Sediminicoccus rosea]UPY39022.1 cysteine dioxygenase family protein [Sediminicoccus rosea]